MRRKLWIVAVDLVFDGLELVDAVCTAARRIRRRRHGSL